MKKIPFFSAAAAAAVALAAMPVSAFADEAYVYGTMNIPYTDFYAAELGDSAGEVDAVTSATKNKALKNGEGELFEGSYNNGEDTILGVTYPVALTQSDLDALGSDNYGFQPLDTVPEAYKIVTVSDGKASFSAVQDAAPENADLGVKLSTETPWGDYLMDFTGQPEGFDTYYRGAVLKTDDGKAYAMRHEQNIWRGEIAWSSGIKTSEPHGNQLDYEAYVGLMGSTVKEIVLITKAGYVNVSTSTYIPVKFAGALTVENSNSGTGKTAFTSEGIPADYQTNYSVGDGFTVSEGEIHYTDAAPGSYTLTVSDGAGKYADMLASFVLETEDLPVQYADGKLVPADGFTEEQAQAFIRNIASVEVGESKYNASGKGSVKVFDETGAINFDAESRNGKVFADGADAAYDLTVSATGYRNPLTIALNQVSEETTAQPEETAAEETTTETETAPASEENAGNNTGNSGAQSGNVAGPKTADAGMGMTAALAAAAGAAAFVLRRKRQG